MQPKDEQPDAAMEFYDIISRHSDLDVGLCKDIDVANILPVPRVGQVEDNHGADARLWMLSVSEILKFLGFFCAAINKEEVLPKLVK